MIDQLPLNIHLRDDATLANYYSGDNKEALSAVLDIANGIGETFIYLWGQTGVGRTHLLQAACHKATEAGSTVLYIALKDEKKVSPAILQGIEVLSLICIDDIDSVAGKPEWEEALFHLFNKIRAINHRLMISSTVSPKDLSFVLPDLKSRLAWGVIYQLQRLTDEQKIQTLQLRAEHRGLVLTETVGQFLLNRCSRDMPELFAILEKLDRASLAEQRGLTIPFVKHVLGI